MKVGQRVKIKVCVDKTERVEGGKVKAIHGNECTVKLDSGRTVTAFRSQVGRA